MGYITESRKKEIENVVATIKMKSLSDIVREEGIEFYEADLSSLGKISGAFFFDKEKGNYVILVEKTDNPKRKRFSLAHEVGHYFLHRESVKKLDTPLLDGDDSFALFRFDNVNDINNQELEDMETEANWFAAALLMPEDLVRRAYIELGYSIKSLSDLFMVSEQAITYRLINLSLISK